MWEENQNVRWKRWMQTTRLILTLSHYRLSALLELCESPSFFPTLSLHASAKSKSLDNVCICLEDLHFTLWLFDDEVTHLSTHRGLQQSFERKKIVSHLHKCDCTQYCSQHRLSTVVFYHSRSFVKLPRLIDVWRAHCDFILCMHIERLINWKIFYSILIICSYKSGISAMYFMILKIHFSAINSSTREQCEVTSQIKGWHVPKNYFWISKKNNSSMILLTSQILSPRKHIYFHESSTSITWILNVNFIAEENSLISDIFSSLSFV